MALLRLQRKRRDGPGLQAPQGDRVAGLLAIAVGAVVDPREGGVDLGDELALAIPGAKIEVEAVAVLPSPAAADGPSPVETEA